MAHIQDIRRAISLPALADADQALQEYARSFVLPIAQQLQLVHSSFESQQISVPNGSANVIVGWRTPAPEANYVAVATPSWATIVSYSGKTLTQIQFNFSVVAPGAQTLLVLRVR
jgi:hypothetical protein